MRTRLPSLTFAAGTALVIAVIPASADHVPADSRNMDVLFMQQNAFNATNSDLAFWGDLAFAGNYAGFRIFDISDPANPSLVSEVACDGPQNDVSVWDRDGDGEADLLFLSVDAVMTGPECGAARAPAADLQNPDNWEGIRIFDVSNPANPVELDPVYQHCGSHTHTLVPDPDNNRVLLYNSSYPLRPGPSCGPDNPAGRDPLHGVIQVVEVAWDASNPLDNSRLTAGTIAEPEINYTTDPNNQFVAQERGLIGPFDPLRACHDIAVFMPRLLAAGACAQEAQLWRIDPDTLLPDTANPLWVFDDPVDENGATGDPNDPEIAVDFWHSATFSWDGKVVNFSDEAFAGFDPTGPPACPPQSRRMEFVDGEWVQVGAADTGRTHFFDVDTGTRFSHFMINRPDPDAYCSTHQGNVVFMPGRNLLVQAWYQGGVNIVDFTSPRNPREIAYLDLLPLHEMDHGSDNWSHYWYERNPKPGTPVITYGTDGHDEHGRGFQVFEATVGKGKRFGLDYLNPQTQEVMRR